MVLLAAVKVLLARYTGQPDVAVGTPWSTRHSVDSESLIGLFLDSLVLRTDLSGDPTFAELLRRVRDVTLGAYESGGLPFERLAAELGLGLAPFDVEFVVNNLAPASWTLPGVEAVEHHVAAGPARFDLTVAFGDVSAGLTGFIRYRTALFDRERIERMCEDLMTLLAAVALDPARRLSDVAVAYDGRTNRATSSPR
jgi:non-ribosomal peptide synthetase component F